MDWTNQKQLGTKCLVMSAQVKGWGNRYEQVQGNHQTRSPHGQKKFRVGQTSQRVESSGQAEELLYDRQQGGSLQGPQAFELTLPAVVYHQAQRREMVAFLKNRDPNHKVSEAC